MTHVKYGQPVIPKQVSRECIEAETRGLQECLVEIAQQLKGEALDDY
jgi:hypothetical protein